MACGAGRKGQAQRLWVESGPRLRLENAVNAFRPLSCLQRREDGPGQAQSPGPFLFTARPTGVGRKRTVLCEAGVLPLGGSSLVIEALRAGALPGVLRRACLLPIALVLMAYSPLGPGRSCFSLHWRSMMDMLHWAAGPDIIPMTTPSRDPPAPLLEAGDGPGWARLLNTFLTLSLQVLDSGRLRW